jgi:bacterioferritin-associated ferredoxin
MLVHHRRACLFMIVCSCNIISDHDVRATVDQADDVLRHAKHVYECLGCSVECGRCVRSVKAIIDEALGPCAQGCEAGCRHERAEPSEVPSDEEAAEFALAAC